MNGRGMYLCVGVMLLVGLVGCGSVTSKDTSVSITETNENSAENVIENDVLIEYERSLLEVETLKSKNLKEAYDEILELQVKYPDDVSVRNLLEEIEEEYTDACIQKLTDYSKNQDYVNVVEVYDSNITLLSKSDTASELYQSAIDKYFDNAIRESDKIFYTEGVEAACANIAKYKISTIDSRTIDDRIELYKLYEPVRMIDLDAFYFEGKESYVNVWGPNDQDNVGNSGFWGYRYYVCDTGWADENRYKYWEWKYTYLLNGEYNNFDAILATTMESKDYVEDRYDAYIEVYNGDVLLFESEKIKGGVAPQEIHVDITNAQEVMIVVKGRAFNCGSSKKFEVGLLNPTFSKTIPEALE